MLAGMSAYHDFTAAVEHDKNAAAEMFSRDSSLVNLRSSIGETPFHYLAVENDLESAKFLLKHGAQINTRNHFGQTPLINAATLGYLDMCKFLVERGADFLLKAENGETALSEAARKQNLELVEYFLTKIVVDVNELFCDMDAEEVLTEPGPVCERLKACGLRRRYGNE